MTGVLARVGDAIAESHRRRTDPLARLLGAPPVRRDIGAECEWRVRLDGTEVDFRAVVGRLLPDRVRRHPTDPRAVELSDGSQLTADGWEAEVATPPVGWGPDAVATVTGHLAAGRAELLGLLDPLGDATLAGFSTHVNASVPDRRAVRVARRIVRQAGPLLAWACDAPGSPGVLVRPRRGRLELGGEFLGPEQTGAALVALVGLVTLFNRPRPLLPRVAVPCEPARERFGWFLPRPAPDRLAAWRPAAARVWDAARAGAAASGFDVALVDRVLAGEPATASDAAWVGVRPVDAAALPERLEGPGWTLLRTWSSWDTLVWQEPHPGGRCLVVPWAQRHAFLAAADAGGLDRLLARVVDA